MEKTQFLYQLKLIPALLDESNWTDKENNIVQHHFEVLQNLQQEGTLILGSIRIWNCYFGSKFRRRSNYVNGKRSGS